ncbi:MAG: TlpA family protein disulfide reductase [Chitinophagaceae bacterium]|jgi:thiol-disulfide isomerase/thioredoxin|nr:TlpA family protein disulfide reductase [Chitinophagaceae bacterium]
MISNNFYKVLFFLLLLPTVGFGQSSWNEDEVIAGLIPEIKSFADSIIQMKTDMQQPMLKTERENLIKKYNSSLNTYTDRLVQFTELNKHNVKPASALYYSYNTELVTDTVFLEKLLNTLAPDGLNNDYAKYMQQELAGLRNGTVGAAMVSFTEKDISGKQISLTDFKGKYLLLNFWASWCAPCRSENPSLENLYLKYKSKNFEVVAVSLDENKTAWKQAVAQDKLTWTNICNGNAWRGAPARLYSIHRVPQNILVNPAGIIIAKNISLQELEKKLGTLLGE